MSWYGGLIKWEDVPSVGDVNGYKTVDYLTKNYPSYRKEVEPSDQLPHVPLKVLSIDTTGRIIIDRKLGRPIDFNNLEPVFRKARTQDTLWITHFRKKK